MLDEWVKESLPQQDKDQVCKIRSLPDGPSPHVLGTMDIGIDLGQPPIQSSVILDK